MICRIMDFEEPISKGLKENGEKLIRNCVKGDLHCAVAESLVILVSAVMWLVKNVPD